MISTAFQSSAFQNNAYQIDATSGADSWPGDPWKNKHKDTRREEYEELLRQVNEAAYGREEHEDAIVEAIVEQRVERKSKNYSQITARTATELKREFEARAQARLIEEDDEEVLLLI